MALYSRQPPPRDRWLIPGALGFLALAVLFAAAMQVFPGDTGAPVTQPASAVTPVPLPSTPSPSKPPSPKPTPSPTPSPSVDGVRIRSALTGLCLAVAGGVDPEGAAVEQDTCVEGPGQRWRLVAADGGAAQVVNVASGKCLDVNGAGTDDGTRIQQWSCTGGANQKWQPQPVAGDQSGAVQLVAVHSGKCLDLPAQQTGAGSALQEWSCNGGANQHWTVAQ